MRRIALGFAAVLLLTAAARRHAVVPPPFVNLDLDRSLVVTDQAVISGMTLERTLQALINRAGVTQTPLALYRQWLDTQNPKPGMFLADAPHCDDFITNAVPSFNGFARRCPTPEGSLAMSDPFTAHEYTTTGVINRFDQTPADGSNCGQYRIVFARTSGAAAGTKLEIIFEGVLPNPNPSAGIAACRPVAQFWADLTKVDSALDRRALVEKFFFDGIPGFAPLVTPENFNNGGRVRNKHRDPSSGEVPRFYQFVVEKRCTNGDCKLFMQPDVVENAPHPGLYNASLNTPLGAEFRDEFIRQIPTLALRDINYYLDFPKKYDVGETTPPDSVAFGSQAYFQSINSQAGKDFDARVRQELARVKSTLTPLDLLIRADTQFCGGCHLGRIPVGDGLTFPAAVGDSHVAPGSISPALRDVFGPSRAKALSNFLVNGTPPPAHMN